MAARPTTSTRWVIGILVAALLACVLVVVGLIQITGGTSSAPASDSAAPSSASPSASPAPSSSPAVARSEDESSAAPASTSASPTTTPVELAGSGLVLPAAWSGTADLTITVLGRCQATGGTSLYTRPAQFALQVSPPAPTTSPTSGSGEATPASGQGAGALGQSPTAGAPSAVVPDSVAADSSAPTSGSGVGLSPSGPVSMSLGITSTDVPGLSIYSTSSGRDGSIRRTWQVEAAADPSAPERTLISATLVDDQPLGGALPPNLLVDSETDLQPCETDSGVRLTRPLAKGATVTGWVSATDAVLQVNATTTDGERSVTADLTLTRTPGP